MRKYVARKFNLVKLMTLHGKSLSKLTKVQPNQSSPAIIPPVLLFPSFPLFLSTVHTHTLFVSQYFILHGCFGCPSSSISTLPSLYLKLPLYNLHVLPAVGAPFVSPPFQIQTVLCIVVKLLLSAYIDLTFPFNRHFALWFPIVGNKGVGTTIVVVFLPEVT